MAWLYEQPIVSLQDSEQKLMQVKILSQENLAEILIVQEKVIAHLDNQKTLQPLSADEYAHILSGKGLMVGAFVENHLIGFRALFVPEIDDEHLGFDIGLPENELSKVIYQEISMVLPDFRGNGIQKTLAKLIMAELKKLNQNFRYVCSTVAPFNIPSLKDKFSQGMVIKAVKEKYGSKLRYIFVKDLCKEMDTYEEVQRVPMENIQEQQRLLSLGYEGFQMEIIDNDIWVLYGKNDLQKYKD